MYTMMLMVSVASGGDTASFGGRSGCHGSCHGYTASYCAPVSYGCTGHHTPYYGCTGCVGYVAPVSYGCSGYTPYHGCSGYTTSYGSCCGKSTGGFLGLCRKSHSCGGCHSVSYGCGGYTPYYGCSGYTPTYGCGGCGGVIYSAPAVAMPVAPAPAPMPMK